MHNMPYRWITHILLHIHYALLRCIFTVHAGYLAMVLLLGQQLLSCCNLYIGELVAYCQYQYCVSS